MIQKPTDYVVQVGLGLGCEMPHPSQAAVPAPRAMVFRM